MRYLIKAYEGLLLSMAVLAGVLLVWLMVSVALSVLQRNFGIQPWAWLFLSAEYSMFYLTLLGAPWLVRQRGHVHIELLTATLPPKVLPWFSRAVALLCAVVCAVLAWKGADLVMMNVERGDIDLRAYFFPMWILSVAFPISFGLLTIEFARFVFGRETLHTGVAGIQE